MIPDRPFLLIIQIDPVPRGRSRRPVTTSGGSSWWYFEYRRGGARRSCRKTLAATGPSDDLHIPKLQHSLAASRASRSTLLDRMVVAERAEMFDHEDGCGTNPGLTPVAGLPSTAPSAGRFRLVRKPVVVDESER